MHLVHGFVADAYNTAQTIIDAEVPLPSPTSTIDDGPQVARAQVLLQLIDLLPRKGELPTLPESNDVLERLVGFNRYSIAPLC